MPVPQTVLSPYSSELDLRVTDSSLRDGSHAKRHQFTTEHVVDKGQGGWQTVELALKGDVLSRGLPYAPRLVTFAIGLGRHLNKVELDNLRLTDSQGRQLLANGDFEAGLARWFTTSDRYHLPWHAKNLALHLLFEQGLLGLGAFALAIGTALWRVSFGAARAQPLAPALAGALVALLVVGLVDSILDMPRIALLTLLLLSVALALPGRRGAGALHLGSATDP